MTLIAEQRIDTPIEPKGITKDRLPNRYIVDVDFVIDCAAATDQELERSIAIVATGLQDGSIQAQIGAKLIISLVSAFKDVTRIHNVMKLLRESGMEVSQAEVQRIEAARFTARTRSKS